MKLLVVVPSLKLMGGVSAHYAGLYPHWTSDVRYITYGKRPHLPAVLCFLPDLIAYVWSLLTFRPDVVVVNPSFRPYQLRRDGLYIWIAAEMGRRVVAMFHGWDYAYSKRMKDHPDFWVWLLQRCSFVYVLYSGFRTELEAIGIHVPLLLTTTQVKDELVEGYTNRGRNGVVRNILFLARIDRAKGIYEAIDAFHIAHSKYPYLHLTVCGTNEDKTVVEEVKAYVVRNGIPDVTFRGAVSGGQKRDAFIHSDLYLLSSYQEGMATSVLEAMAFGLPVISRPVGGIRDFFIEGRMGYLLESLEPADYADRMVYLIEHPAECKDMSSEVYHYARTHFLASTVASTMEQELKRYCMM